MTYPDSHEEPVTSPTEGDFSWLSEEDLSWLPKAPEAETPMERLHMARRGRLLKQWEGARATSDELAAKGASRIERLLSQVSGGEALVKEGLAPLVLFAQERLQGTRPQTLAGLSVTLQADLADPSVIDDEGDVASDSQLYRVLDFLENVKQQGVSAPAETFRKFIESSSADIAWVAMRALLVPTFQEPAASPRPSYSVLDTPVTVTATSGRTTADVLKALDAHIGLNEVKTVAHHFAAVTSLDEARRRVGLPGSAQSRHMAFLGNPGTGKTMVARVMADLIASISGTGKAPFVEADRSMLLGEWLGSTALKVRHVAEAAYGGVLFIDEAYSLVGAGDGGADRFAQEAIDTLVKVMEDERDRLTVILAGYPEPMMRLLQANPGLASRIGLTVNFPDYASSDLMHIFTTMAKEQGFVLAQEAGLPIYRALQEARELPGFGNARIARNLFEGCVRALALRLSQECDDLASLKPHELMTIRLADSIQAVHACAYERSA